MAKAKAAEPAIDETTTANTGNAVSLALDAMKAALIAAEKWTEVERSLYEDAVQLAQKQGDAIDQIASFEFASDEPRGPAHGAIEQMRRIASDARGA